MDPAGEKIERVLVGVSGSVAVLGVQSYLAAFRALLAREVRVIMTHAAAELLPPSTVSLFCDGVFVEETPSTQRQPGHVELARWCDLFVVIPATANLIGQVAQGLAPNLLSTTILASPEPVVFCPNMNEAMWKKRAVQRNIETLREDNHTIIEPALVQAYEVASGEIRENWVLPDPEHVVDQLYEMHLQRELPRSYVG